jgi:hypothetical protein
MKKRHKVKVHNWEKGILKTREYIFESTEEAEVFMNTNTFYMAKRYDHDGRLVESQSHKEGRNPHTIETIETYS